jgi:putative copper resistance protein D
VIAALAVIRWFHEISLMLLFGGAALTALARLPSPDSSLRLRAVAVALISAILWFCLAAAQMGGGLTPEVLQLALGHTLFGQVLHARVLLLLLVVLAVWRGWRESLIALLSGTALVLVAVTSHAAVLSPDHFAAIGIISDGLHLITAGFWIGGLTVLAALFARRDIAFAPSVGLFAQWGMIAVTLLILTGMLNAAMVLLGGQGHVSGLYLAVLGSKLVLVAGMVILALANHVRLLPRLAEPQAADWLFHNIRREFLLGLVVVGLAMLLTLLPPTL